MMLAGSSRYFLFLCRIGSRSTHLSLSLSQFEYAAQLTEIVAMFSAKTAIALLSDRVAPRKRRDKISTLTCIAVWTIFSLFALAFQWPLPPTDYLIVAFNALTDVALVLWTLHIRLETSNGLERLGLGHHPFWRKNIYGKENHRVIDSYGF